MADDDLEDLMHDISLESEDIVEREVYVDAKTVKESRSGDDICLLRKPLI